MEQRQICISVFNTDTREKFWTHPESMGHSTKVHCVHAGDIVLLYDMDTKEVFGIGILRAIDNGKIYKETHPYDQDLYNNDYSKYNKYEIGVKVFPIEPVLVQTINEECGLTITQTLVKGHHISFKRTSQNLAPWANRVLLEKMITKYM
jgi:hypothetical protein